MNTLEKRDYIHNFLYVVDDSIIDEMYKQVQSIVEREISLTEDQEEELERRVARHKSGQSKSFSWEEVKTRAISGNEL
jgi:putative addiction module component (TIGR02574 family)